MNGALVRAWFREGGDAWLRFWFTPSDPATLGAVRVFAGSMLLYTHFVWGLDLLGFFGNQGRLSIAWSQAYHKSSAAWSYLYITDSAAFLWTVHIIALIALLMFTLGLYTRVTSVLAFLITVAYAHRGAGALFGLDQINGMLALYLMIGPSGAAYSLDNMLARRSAAQGRAGQGGAVAEPSTLATTAIRLMQVHMCVIYLFAGLGKLLGPSWWEGTALWGALANYEYQTIDMSWLADAPLTINFLSHLTLFWELSYIALVWPRWTRPVVLALAIPLHLGIGMAMGMMTFGLVMLIGNLAFVPPEVVRAAAEKLDPRQFFAGQQSETAEASAKSSGKSGRSRRRKASR